MGMTMEQVRALLGEPESVDANFVITVWWWGERLGPSVTFDTESRTVRGWQEPL